ncbi:MAG TPA: cell surface protein SprA, partial [Phaeodactylibacter sp.]|nr:cell surface protein SprA [Phaeodactylibacter sp.]
MSKIMKNVNLFFSFLLALGCYSISLANFGGSANLDNPFIPEIIISNDTIPLQERFGDFVNEPNTNPFDLNDPSVVEQNVEYDPETGMYIITEKIGDDYFRMPTYMTFNEYMDWRAEKEQQEYFRQLSGISSQNTSVNGKVDPLAKMDLKNDLINRLFGGTEVNIQPQGNIDLTFGVDFQNIENPILTPRQQKQGGFDFDMNIQLNVQGSIGEKLKLATNYNTQATFDFDNQLKLEYDSDAFGEDDIIKKIEAGNVSLPLRSTLIQGAQSLFGLKTELQFGHLRLTAIASQQKSKREEIEIKGGSQIQEFEVTAEEYDENRHFFLSHYNRDHFEDALKNMPNINSLMRITKIEVWLTNDGNDIANTRDIVAIADLGEYDKITNDNPLFQTPLSPRNRDVFQTDELPDNTSNDIYQAISNNPIIGRPGKAVGVLTGPQFNFEQTKDFEKTSARLLQPSEYTYNAELGFISVNVNVRPDQVLGVAYQYNYGGEDRVYQVGEMASNNTLSGASSQDSVASDQVLFVKLLKSTTQRTDLPTWDLMMKNIYSIGAYQVNQEDFKLDIFYDDPGGGQKRFLPETNLKGVPLLRVFNLDNLNVQGDPQPDGVFDFVSGVTINTRNGRVMFPVLEPFGSSLTDQIDDPGFKEFYSFQMLYDSTITRAQEFPEFNRFTIKGTYKSAVSNEISLGSFNLPQGSVRVTAGGAQLEEGIDYEIDYNIGRIKILNDAILNSGAPVRVSFEDNSLFGFQTKTLLGLRADYEVSDNFSMGGTFLNLFERPFTQKVNVGDDPINNKIFGLDFNYSTESPWLTRMVDRIPLIDTKAPSKITMLAEGAALRPGHSKAINQQDAEGNKDKGGSVFIDDFEGSASSIDLRRPANKWVPASIPYNSVNPLFPESALIDSPLSGVNRAALSWYRIRDDYDDNDPYAALIQQTEVFPNKELTPSDNPTLQTFDLTYAPSERGVYNYDVPGGTQYSAGVTNVGGKIKLEAPETRWAGIMRELNTNDFEASNIEFVEFWMLNPFMQKADGSASSGAGNLYINLGNISEDILKDSRLFAENGLPSGTGADQPETDQTTLARVPVTQPLTNSFSSDPEKRILQDVGYDGLDDAAEQTFFADYVNSMAAIGINLTDVSNDNFVSPLDDNLQGQPVSVRYANFSKSQGNSPSGTGGSSSQGKTQPDTEDLNDDNTLSETEAYFEYKIPLVPTGPAGDSLKINEFITESIAGKDGRVWYRFKIPVTHFTNRVGSIQGFRSIRFIRLYMQGFDEKITFRFA